MFDTTLGPVKSRCTKGVNFNELLPVLFHGQSLSGTIGASVSSLQSVHLHLDLLSISV